MVQGKQIIYGANVEFRQSSKPTVRSDGSALVAGDRWLDTTDRIWFFWNGTYWLSEQLFEWVLPATNITVSTPQATRPIPINTSYNYYLTNFFFQFTAGGSTYDATNRWDVTLRRLSASSASSDATISITSGTSANRQTQSTAVNLHRDVSSLAILAFDVQMTKFAAPSDLSSPTGRCTYRLAKP